MKLPSASCVSKSQTNLNFFTPMPRPACTSSIFMNVSFLVALLTAIPFPEPPPAKKIFIPKLLNTAYPAAFSIAPFDVGCNLYRRLSVSFTVLRTSACFCAFVAPFFAAQTGATENREPNSIAPATVTAKTISPFIICPPQACLFFLPLSSIPTCLHLQGDQPRDQNGRVKLAQQGLDHDHRSGHRV